MPSKLFQIILPLALVACGSLDRADESAEPSVSATAYATALASATESPNTASDSEGVSLARNDARNGSTWEFRYSWPAEVSAEPKLAAALAKERDARLTRERAEWEATLADTPGDCRSCRNRSFARQWKVVANLPRFLSLSSDIATYTGGAHGNSGTQGLVWDREAEKRIEPIAFFTSAPALENAVATPFCEALNRLRERRRGQSIEPDEEDIFSRCPDIAELTVLLGSSNGETFDRIGLIADPYVAGSYAEGNYEVTLPVTPRVLDAVRPEYRPAFALHR